MDFKYNKNYYDGKVLHDKRKKKFAYKTYKTVDGIIIGLFQGKRGQYPQLDFIIKILQPGEDNIPFPPKHNLWVVDLLMKINDYKKEVKQIVEYYIEFYNKIKPFSTVEEREKYDLQTVEYITKQYDKINQKNTLSIEYVAIIMELFCINEKRNDGAYMFKDLLHTIKNYTEDRCDYISLIRATSPGFR